MQVIYSVATATNDSYDKKYNIASVIPYDLKTTFIVDQNGVFFNSKNMF